MNENVRSRSLLERHFLPERWARVRIRNIGHDWGQKIPDRPFTYIDVGSINNSRGIISEDLQILNEAEAPSRARKIVRQDTVIYATVQKPLPEIKAEEVPFELPKEWIWLRLGELGFTQTGTTPPSKDQEMTKAPLAQETVGRNPTDRGKKWLSVKGIWQTFICISFHIAEHAMCYPFKKE